MTVVMKTAFIVRINDWTSPPDSLLQTPGKHQKQKGQDAG